MYVLGAWYTTHQEWPSMASGEVVQHLGVRYKYHIDGYKETTDTMGDFPGAEQEKYALPTTEFEYPNDHKFTVDYKCRKSATGMFSDCGVYSANTAWTADPYKGLNCPLSNTKTPEIPSPSDTFNKRETEYGEPRKSGISGTGNSMLR